MVPNCWKTSNKLFEFVFKSDGVSWYKMLVSQYFLGHSELIKTTFHSSFRWTPMFLLISTFFVGRSRVWSLNLTLLCRKYWVLNWLSALTWYKPDSRWLRTQFYKGPLILNWLLRKVSFLDWIFFLYCSGLCFFLLLLLNTVRFLSKVSSIRLFVELTPFCVQPHRKFCQQISLFLLHLQLQILDLLSCVHKESFEMFFAYKQGNAPCLLGNKRELVISVKNHVDVTENLAHSDLLD